MHGDNPDANPLPGQGDDLDRGTGTGASGGALGGDEGHAPQRDVVVEDDEFARPKSDRSPLT